MVKECIVCGKNFTDKPSDNRPENLELFNSHSAHMKIHNPKGLNFVQRAKLRRKFNK